MDDTSSRDEAFRCMERHVRFDFHVPEDSRALTPQRPTCSSTTYPEVTWPNYPEGFQGTEIPVHGPYVAKLIEDRADGLLP